MMLKWIWDYRFPILYTLSCSFLDCKLWIGHIFQSCWGSLKLWILSKVDRRTKVHQPIRKKILGWSCSLVFPPVFLVKFPFRLIKISTFAGDMGPSVSEELPKHPAFWDLDVHQASLSSGLLLCNASPAWAGNAAPRIAVEFHGTGYCHHLVTLGR